MSDPQDTPLGAEVVEEDAATLTDEEIETRGLTSAPQGSVDDGDDSGDESDPTDSGDDAGDDSGDESDPTDSGDDAGDESDPTDTGDDSGDSGA